MPDIVLATGRVMPHGDAAENPLLVDALKARGVDATIEPWGTPAALDARLVMIRTTWDYTAHCEEFLAWAREVAATTQLINPVDIIVWNSHKSYLLDLAYAGVPMIATTMVPGGASASEQHGALREYDGEVVIKPAISVGAIGAMRTLGTSVEAEMHLDSLAASGDVLVQPFLPAITAGEISLIYFGEVFSHAIRKVPADGDYRVQSFHGGRESLHSPTAEEHAVGLEALAALAEPVAYARVDLVNSSTGPVVMEVELIEPQLFLDREPDAPGRLADHLVAVLSAQG